MTMLRSACDTVWLKNPPAVAAECCRVLNMLLANLVGDPTSDKFRTVKSTNAKLKAAVFSPQGGEAVLLACGFERVESGLEMRAEDAGARAAEGQAALDAASIAFGGPFALCAQLPHSSSVRAICGLGNLVATGAMDNAVRLWPAEHQPGEPQPLETLAGQPGCHEGVKGVNGVLSVVQTPTGLLASAGRDKVLVWGQDSKGGYAGSPIAAMSTHGDARGADVTNASTVVALAHDGAGRLWSASWDATVRGWQPLVDDDQGGTTLGNGADPSVLRAGDVAVLALCVLEDGRLASGGGDGMVTLWREGAGSPGGGFEASATCDTKCVVRGLAALPGGGFAQVGNDGVLKVWSAAGALETKTDPVGGYLYAVAAAALHDGASTLEIFTGGDDGSLRVWRRAGPLLQCVQRFVTPGEIYEICATPSLLLLAADEVGGPRLQPHAARLQPQVPDLQP